MNAGFAVSVRPLRLVLAGAAALTLAVAMTVVAAPAANAAAVGTFQTLASSSQPLASVTVDRTTGVIYAQGNEDTTFFKYDPASDTWTQLADAPINSGNNGGAAYLNGKIYTIYTDSGPDMGVYDIASNTWSTMPIPAGIFAADGGTGNITAVGNLLYLVVGNVFESLNPQTGVATNLADAPDMDGCGGYTEWGALVQYQGKIYGHQGNNCTGMAVYDIASNSWTTLSDTPDGAALGAAIDPVSGTYYAYGPYGGTNWYSYDIGSDTWSTQTSPFTDQGDGGMAYVGTPGLEGVYAVEGETGTAFTRFVTPAGSADMSLTKTASVSSVTVGQTFSYTLKASNAGPNDSMSTTITDTLPSGVTFVSATPSSGTCSGSTTVTCHLGAVFAGDSATVTLMVKAAAPGTTTNTASVSSSEPDSNSANNSASVSVTIKAVPPPPAPKPTTKKLKLSVSPGSVVAGTHKCFAFKATSSGKGVGGVSVKFAGKKAHTSSKGKAQICVTFKKKGSDRASASKKGYTTAHATVHVKPKPAKKPVHFTG